MHVDFYAQFNATPCLYYTRLKEDFARENQVCQHMKRQIVMSQRLSFCFGTILTLTSPYHKQSRTIIKYFRIAKFNSLN